MTLSLSSFGISLKNLPKGWRIDRLDTLASFNPEVVTAQYPHSEIVYLDIGNVGAGSLRKTETISLLNAPSRAKRIVRTGDTILSTVRPGNRAFAFISNASDNLIVSTGFAVLRPKAHTEPRFVYYLATSNPIINYLASIAEEKTAYPSVNPEDIAECAVPVPPLAEQRAIAHILGMQDDKIELNRRMSETLEAMAQALFKSWFVDFDPVRAKMDGRWRKGESLPGLPARLYDLFPDRLVDSELGRIPEGWKVRTAGSLFSIGIGKTPPRRERHWFSRDPGHVPWMSIKDLGRADSHISQVGEYLTPEAVERFHVRRIPDGTIVLSFKLTMGRVAITDGEMVSNEAIAHLQPRPGTFLSSGFIYFYLKRFDYETLGSTSSIATAINSESIRAIHILVPSEMLHHEFLDVASAILLRLRSLQRQSGTLAGLRCALLPKIISGELRIFHGNRPRDTLGNKWYSSKNKKLSK